MMNGESGNDRFYGGLNVDTISGGDGNDVLIGEDGNDKLYGGSGRDALRGGTGADILNIWENQSSADTLIFRAADSGRTLGTLDKVEGFVSGIDKINLTEMVQMTFEQLDFAGDGAASCYYDGKYLRFDINGDRASDMIVEFTHVESLRATDFVFA